MHNCLEVPYTHAESFGSAFLPFSFAAQHISIYPFEHCIFSSHKMTHHMV